MARDLCPTCAGAGESSYWGANEHMEVRTCETCWGSGFEREPTLRQMRYARTALEAAVKALEVSL
jgi:DnaJ-class molecular chaperone